MLLASAAQAQTFPKLSGQVVDEAHLLDAAQAAALTAKLATVEQQTGRQFVVATVTDLQGYDIADYGYRLGRAWGIGSKEQNDGVLLLVAPNERKVKIEVGYGLEPYLTDALSSVIINTQITPRFRGGDMAGGIAAGADAIIAQLQLPEDQAQARQQQLLAQAKDRQDDGIPVALIFWIIVMVVFVLPALFGRRGRRFRGGAGPVVIWGGDDHWGGGWGGGSGAGWGGGGGGGGFSGGGGSFGGGGASGGW
ncbi:TPM domain-containing protein [Sphingomonas flavalba]|uniref:TPM domain-containing protein n=1 Tax=Sphingomonas flavalba TaxID=2559804 RepID=UPI0039E0C1F7